MTIRALLIGLLLGLAIAGLGYMNDWELQQSKVASDLVPVSVYGLLILGLLIVNPLLKVIRNLQFKGREWAVIVSLMLVACVIPGPGLMWTFSQTLVMPYQFEKTNPAWRQQRLLDYAPDVMLVDLDNVEGAATRDQASDEVLTSFMQGSGSEEFISPDKVPWGAWIPTLSFWLPLLALSFIAGICLVLIVHRQWVHRERLRYPVAEFASTLVHDAETGAFAPVLHNHKFWLGFIPVLVIFLINGLKAWYPNSIQIPLRIDLTMIGEQWTYLQGIPAGDLDMFLKPTVFFAAVGFAYFISSEVSLSMGISQILYWILFLWMARAGVEMSKDYLAGGLHSFQLFGAYLGLGLMIFYIGRKFYLSVLMRALFIPAGDDVRRSVTWACRIALLSALGMVLMLVFVLNLNWMLAILFVMLTGLLFMMTTRINVETGLFFIQPTWHAVGIIGGMFGMAALGPNMLIILALLAAVMTIDPRVCLMPLAANALRFSEQEDIRPSRLGRWMVVAVLLALVVGVFGTIYIQYNYGGTQNAWLSMPGEMAFNMLLGNRNEVLTGSPEQWAAFDWAAIAPDREFLTAAGVGLALVLVCSALRLRFTWWPIHPVLFLVWGTFPMANLAPSFLLGWIIKGAVTRFGGGRSYNNNKPLFVGLVAGEFAAGIFWTLYNLAYYLITGVKGKPFGVHP